VILDSHSSVAAGSRLLVCLNMSAGKLTILVLIECTASIFNVKQAVHNMRDETPEILISPNLVGIRHVVNQSPQTNKSMFSMSDFHWRPYDVSIDLQEEQ
jgi:hypothetical protein